MIRKFLPIFSLFFIFFGSKAQELSGDELLAKAITYHDPSGNWQSFNGKLQVTMETPDSSSRDSEIQINLPEEYFYVKAVKDTTSTEYTINKQECTIAFNGTENPSEAIKKERNLSCERAELYKNYYTYLYGLPMKLKDPGTIIHPKTERKTFKGKEYLVLKATYEKGVGKDVWFFYFNTETYAMEIYQFFKGDPSAEGKETGEYIMLTEEKVVNDIRMPKNRAWYYNKDDKYLGTDILN